MILNKITKFVTMSTSPEDKALLLSLNSQFTQFQNSTKSIETLTDAEKRIVSDSIHSEGVIMHYLNPIAAIGDKVFGHTTDPLFGDYRFYAKVGGIPITENNLIDVDKL
jgi:hypothetical protein